MTVADLLVAELARYGVRMIFGVPGGGGNLDVIAAARAGGLRFVLSHTETGAAIMAAAQAEITGSPGACLATLGPGVSSIVNGVAHAWLDRVPLMVITDALAADARACFPHQNLDHRALLAPITHFSADLTAEHADALVVEALRRALGDPPGPAHLDCAGAVASSPVQPALSPSAHESTSCPALTCAAETAIRSATRPLMIVGLGARAPEDTAAVRQLCESRCLPVLVTYKGKGIVADDHPLFAGVFTLGDIERPLIEASDLVLTVGVDPVELLPRPWPFAQPAVHCARWWPTGKQLEAGETVIGDLPFILSQVDGCLGRSLDWSAHTIAAARERQRAVVMHGDGKLTPGRAVAAIADVSRAARHVTVDSGALMFPALALLPANNPGAVLISNGLSTMGFAVPAAIGAALLAPADPVISVTGDGGALMCLGELFTAVREQLRVVVVVFADGDLSLIRIKQDRRGLAGDGVRIGHPDWPRLAAGLGLRSFQATEEAGLRRQVEEALAEPGPTLIEARIDASGYGRMLQTIRG